MRKKSKRKGIDQSIESFDSTQNAATVQVIKLEQPEAENSFIETIPNPMNDGFSGNLYRPSMPKLPNPLLTSSTTNSADVPCSITEISDEPPSKKVASSLGFTKKSEKFRHFRTKPHNSSFSSGYGTGQMHVINVFEETDKLPKRPKKKKAENGDAIHCSQCRLKFA